MISKARELETRDLYARVFAGEEDRIPLIVTPKSSSKPTAEELMADPGAAAKRACDRMADKVEVDADWIPSIGLGWFQYITVPSLYGAKPIYLDGSSPIFEPLFESVAEAARADSPALTSPMFDRMTATFDALQEALPEGFYLHFAPTVSPLCIAQFMVPRTDFLEALYLEPDAALTFLMNLTEVCIETIKVIRKKLKAKNLYGMITNRGIYYPGWRLPCDSLVNLSPEHLRVFALPFLERFGEELGQLCIHYCSKPAPSEHVLPVLCESDHVSAVDTWQGPDAFMGDDAPGRLQSKVALLFDVDLSTPQKMDSFLDWEPVRTVPRRNGRGIVIHTTAPTAAEGRRIYEAWRERQSA